MLVNGSFEATTIPNGSSNYASVPGWTALTGGRIELWKAHRKVTASNGANLAELDFDTALDGFYQDVQTAAGQSHSLTFDLRRRADIADTTPGIEILWNGTVVATTTPGANWGSFTVSSLIGTGGLDRLTIREVQSESSDGRGALVDNFRLIADPVAPLAARMMAEPVAAPLAASSAMVSKTAVAPEAIETYDETSFAPGVLASFDGFGSGAAATVRGRAYLYEPALDSSPRRSRHAALAEQLTRSNHAAAEGNRKSVFSTRWGDLLPGSQLAGSQRSLFGNSDI